MPPVLGEFPGVLQGLACETSPRHPVLCQHEPRVPTVDVPTSPRGTRGPGRLALRVLVYAGLTQTRAQNLYQLQTLPALQASPPSAFKKRSDGVT